MLVFCFALNMHGRARVCDALAIPPLFCRMTIQICIIVISSYFCSFLFDMVPCRSEKWPCLDHNMIGSIKSTEAPCLSANKKSDEKSGEMAEVGHCCVHQGRRNRTLSDVHSLLF